MHLVDLIVIIPLAVLLFVIVRTMVKKHGSGCAGCSSCSDGGSCPFNEKMMRTMEDAAKKKAGS